MSRPPRQRLAHSDDNVRLIVSVARMYHERGMSQPQIAGDLHLSQPTVSRLLKSATELGIVHTTVTVPAGIHSDTEEALIAAYRRYGLRMPLSSSHPETGSIQFGRWDLLRRNT